jgi:hypothetical protein
MGLLYCWFISIGIVLIVGLLLGVFDGISLAKVTMATITYAPFLHCPFSWLSYIGPYSSLVSLFLSG